MDLKLVGASRSRIYSFWRTFGGCWTHVTPGWRSSNRFRGGYLSLGRPYKGHSKSYLMFVLLSFLHKLRALLENPLQPHARSDRNQSENFRTATVCAKCFYIKRTARILPFFLTQKIGPFVAFGLYFNPMISRREVELKIVGGPLCAPSNSALNVQPEFWFSS